MFLHMLLFEIRYRLHRLSTYVYFAVFFFLCFWSSEIFAPGGKVLSNGPYVNTVIPMQIMMFGLVVVSAIFGTAILRDFQDDTYQLIFTKPVRKFAYLGGRWAGSFLVCAGIFVSMPLGMLAGSLMPWVDQETLAPIDLWWHFQPYLSFTLTQIFWLGSLFFFVAAMTRRLMIVYLQGVLVIGLYLIVAIYVLEHRDNFEIFWPSVFDPIGMVLETGFTRYWTVAEKNTDLFAWSGVILYNRLLWMGTGLLALLGTFAFFPMSAEQLTKKRVRARVAPEPESGVVPATVAVPRLASERRFGAAALRAQFLSLLRLNFWTVVKEVPFWAIVLLTFLLAVLNGLEAGEWYGTSTWPVTYLMMQAVSGNDILLYVIATLYAGELVWKQRDIRFDQIQDAAPIPTWLHYAAQLTALAGIQAMLMLAKIGAGVGLQTYLGYHKYELSLYFKEAFLITYPNLMCFVVLCLLIHTLLSNKFMAHSVVIGSALIIPILYRYGFENRLYLMGELIPYTYSDMNGYGHFVAGLRSIQFYALGLAGLQAMATILLLRRGTDSSWLQRVREARRRSHSRPLMAALGVLLLATVSAGGWFYYNAHVRNEFRTSEDTRQRQADYEKQYRQYFLKPQPKVTDVEIEADLYPERRSFKAKGHYMLVNRNAEAIDSIYLLDANEAFREIRFDRPAKLEKQDKRLGFHIYKLDTPLKPGETMRLDFAVAHDAIGFKDGGERAEFAFNGMFFDRAYFPTIGYAPEGELSDPVRRRELKLGPVNDLPKQDDPRIQDVNLFTPDSEWITFRTTVSTSPDQIAIAPGYLKREWTSEGRRYFEYDMGDTRINNFFSFVSARYQVYKDEHRGVPIEIYYHPGHEYNLKRMVDSTKKGLDYFTDNFGPYQFRQFRILEFPRYRSFAQSFPNTIPYSEGLGFIMRLVKPEEDIDEVFYITAHELAHQWWGHQLIGSYAQGSNMMSESLAQYSALMIMEKEYGSAQMRKFLRHELDGYLQGRGGETRQETPLYLVQNEPYVWYQKGSVVMYALRDYIGEEALNGALKKFLAKHKFAEKGLPNTTDFMAYLREATPPEMRHMIEDMFETITLFDNKAVSAKVTPEGGKYRVELTVDTRKLRADGLGKETEIAVNDMIDVGVFAGDVKNPKPLVLEKRRINSGNMKFDFLVEEKPTRAGIDPYHKLIDRNPEDNWMPVSGI